MILKNLIAYRLERAMHLDNKWMISALKLLQYAPLGHDLPDLVVTLYSVLPHDLHGE
jgi:hypothetical protein